MKLGLLLSASSKRQLGTKALNAHAARGDGTLKIPSRTASSFVSCLHPPYASRELTLCESVAFMLRSAYLSTANTRRLARARAPCQYTCIVTESNSIGERMRPPSNGLRITYPGLAAFSGPGVQQKCDLA